MRSYNKKISIVLIIVLLVAVTIGYAVLNTTLNINGKSSISKNTWDLYFDNVVVNDGSVEATKIPTISDKTTVDFEVSLNLPGDYYEFTVDVVNNGTIDAMIESIEKTPVLTTEQEKYLNYTITYANDEQITTKQLVKKEETLKLKVKVELRKDVDPSDLPDVGDVLYLSFTVNYVQADESGVEVSDEIFVAVAPTIISGDLATVGSEIAYGNEHFYVTKSDASTVTLFAKYNLYVGYGCSGKLESTCVLYGDEATGLQDSSMVGFVTRDAPRYGTIDFSETNYWGNRTFPAYVYDSNSTIYKYVENYRKYLRSIGASVKEARLISYEELVELGCNDTDCNSAPGWVVTTAYWTGTSYSSSAIKLVLTGYMGGTVPNSFNAYGVRPIIVINKN